MEKQVNKPQEGDEAVFIEHYAIVRDLDNHDEEPYIRTLKQGIEDIEGRIKRSAVKNCVLAMDGNSLEADYCGGTGKSIMARYDGKKWVPIKVITEREVDIEALFKMG